MTATRPMTIESSKNAPDTRPLFLYRTISAHLHALGVLLALGAGLFIASDIKSIYSADMLAILVYTLTGCFVFAVSSFYHYLHDGWGISKKTENTLEKLDHVSIYLFVAGSYHAIVTGLIGASWKYEIIGLVWGFAAIGTVYTIFGHKLPAWARSRFVYTSLFILMGWSFLIKGSAVIDALSPQQLTLLVAGAAAYTSGAIVYIFKRPNPVPLYFGYHEIWHSAVLAGWFFHMLLVANLFA